MKKIILIAFLAISINTFCQTNYSKEQFDQYKRYKSIEHHFSPVHKSIFTLEDGKIIFLDNYTKDEYRGRQKLSYDSRNDLIKSETVYFKDHNATNYDELLIPTIFTYTYDDKNRLIEVSTKEQNYPPSSEIYSDFNELNLPQKKTNWNCSKL